jgi:hypothetical protein
MDEEHLEDLVQFWTGWPSLPTMGEELSVSFLPKEGHVLPAVDFCFRQLKLPIAHEDYEEFKKSMDTSIKYAKVACGRL